MFGYIQDFVINHMKGYGYLITNAMLICAVMITLQKSPKTRKEWSDFALEFLISYGVYLVMCCLYHWMFGERNLDRIVISAFVGLYSLTRSPYDVRVCLVRGSMLIAGMMVMTPISEPIGEGIATLNEDYFIWAQYLTPVSMAAFIVIEVWFLKHFAFDTGSIIGSQYVRTQVAISAITILVEVYAAVRVVQNSYNVVVCLSLWFIDLLTYYLFYTVNRGTEENQILNVMNQKAEMEREKYQATKLNYDELRTIRHEIKNHNFYLRALLEQGRTEEALAYLDRVSKSDADYMKSFDSGNYTVDVVMNHEMAAAKEANVTVNPTILVPRELPFAEEDLCSLLSNLLDNAIEAASQSGMENPQVQISMMPKQEYLFIRVSNPVNPAISQRKVLTLETTKKEHTELHGFGTRIIRRIAEQYNGSVKYAMEEGIFTTNVMLEMPEME